MVRRHGCSTNENKHHPQAMSENEAKSEIATNSFGNAATVVVAAVCLLECPEMLLNYSCSIAVSIVDVSYHRGAKNHNAMPPYHSLSM